MPAEQFEMTVYVRRYILEMNVFFGTPWVAVRNSLINKLTRDRPFSIGVAEVSKYRNE